MLVEGTSNLQKQPKKKTKKKRTPSSPQPPSWPPKPSIPPVRTSLFNQPIPTKKNDEKSEVQIRFGQRQPMLLKLFKCQVLGPGLFAAGAGPWSIETREFSAKSQKL